MGSACILLYAPDIIGHPPVYCRVIADAVRRHDCYIVIAMGFGSSGPEACPDLRPLRMCSNVHFLDTCATSATKSQYLTAEEIVRLQSSTGAQTTLFIEADKSNGELLRIATGSAPRFLGRNIAIFANTSEWYPGEDSFTGAPIRILAPTLRATLGNMKRSLLNRKDTAKYFYERVVLNNEIFDEIWVKDERLARWRGRPLYWMPEVSRPAEELAFQGEHDNSPQNHLRAFLSRNAGREPVLYFGDAAFYKGYDLFIDFISKTRNACAIHAGRAMSAPEWPKLGPETTRQRAALLEQGRLLETDAYIDSQALKRLYFSSVRVYITTHRLALSSSTVIQASEFGRPVLVPDRGLLAYRVMSNQIGKTYRYCDMNDLRRQAEAIWSSDLTTFADPIKNFWKRFDDIALHEFFAERLLFA